MLRRGAKVVGVLRSGTREGGWGSVFIVPVSAELSYLNARPLWTFVCVSGMIYLYMQIYIKQVLEEFWNLVVRHDTYGTSELSDLLNYEWIGPLLIRSQEWISTLILRPSPRSHVIV